MKAMLPPQRFLSKLNVFSQIYLTLAGCTLTKSPLRLLQRSSHPESQPSNPLILWVFGVVPGGGVEPPRYQVPADFESAASASSAIPALRGSA